MKAINGNPCGHAHAPADLSEPGRPWAPGQCRLCWKALNDPAMKAHLGKAGGGACQHLGRRVRLEDGTVKRRDCPG